MGVTKNKELKITNQKIYKWAQNARLENVGPKRKTGKCKPKKC